MLCKAADSDVEGCRQVASAILGARLGAEARVDPARAEEAGLWLLIDALSILAGAMESEELTRITSSMEGTYGKGKYCPSGPESCKDLEQLSKIVAESRDPKELRDAWIGWHAIAKTGRESTLTA